MYNLLFPRLSEE